MEKMDIESNKSCKKYCPHNAGCFWIILGLTTSQRDFPNISKWYFSRLFQIDNWGGEQPAKDSTDEVEEDIEGWFT
jgi:hypothetical protein